MTPYPTRPWRERFSGAWQHHVAVALALGLQLGSAVAHDTWFAPRPADQAVLALGTGNRFPLQEFALTMEQLQRHGCSADVDAAAPAAQPLQFEADSLTALLLRVPAIHLAATAGTSCWAQSVAFDIELKADLVAVYLKEINASAAVRAAWAGLQARGLPWVERYTKHARIELAAASAAAATARPAASGMGLDMLLQGPRAPLQAGDQVVVQVLRDGQPLPDLAVELHGDTSPLGFWQRSDAQGLVRFTVPLPGQWLLRGTELRLSSDRPDQWDSRFVTLALQVRPAVRRAAP